MVERCALSGSDLKIKFRTILLPAVDLFVKMQNLFDAGAGVERALHI